MRFTSLSLFCFLFRFQRNVHFCKITFNTSFIFNIVTNDNQTNRFVAFDRNHNAPQCMYILLEPKLEKKSIEKKEDNPSMLFWKFRYYKHKSKNSCETVKRFSRIFFFFCFVLFWHLKKNWRHVNHNNLEDQPLFHFFFRFVGKN